MTSIRQGLTQAGKRKSPSKDLYFPLRGPAGLFKSKDKHPLCWTLLAYCNFYIKQCPIDILTYHRKGDGYINNSLIIKNTSELLKNIFEEYPQLKKLDISNR